MRGPSPSPSPLRGRHFHCREWALEKLRRCLDARGGGGGLGVVGGESRLVSSSASSAVASAGVLMTGGPGAGKTALCTELVWPQSAPGRASGMAQRCLAWHFCQREDEGSVAVWRFVLSLVEQARASALLPPAYAHALGSPDVAPTLEPLHCQRDPDDTFRRAFLEPLSDLPCPPQSVFVLVDSLDSGYGSGLRGEGGGGVTTTTSSSSTSSSSTTSPMAGRSGSIAELLSRHLHLLPSWLLLVCSARRQNKTICKMFSGFRRLCLDDLRKPPAVRDVQQYILRRLDQEGPLRRQLTPDTADMLNLLHIKSGGCFLFLQRVLDGVAAGLVGLREIRDIPGTLNGLYLWLCQRLFPRRLFAHVRPLLNALLASPKPLTPAQLYAVVWTQNTALRLDDFQTKLSALSSLLIDGPGGSSKLLFHSSFAEWLTDVKYCTQKYLCSAQEGHLMLAMALSLQARSLSTEETCMLGNHLVSSGVHSGDTALLALWMVWTGVPSLGSVAEHGCSAGGGRGDNNRRDSLNLNVTQTHATPPVVIQQEVLQLLMKSGVFPPTCSPDNGPSVGVHCAGSGSGVVRRALQREDSVRALLDTGVSVNRTDPSNGRTLLASAAHAGSADIAALLLCRGADPLLRDHQGQTPLTLAARQGHVGVLQVLLDWAQDQHGGLEAASARTMLEHSDSEGWTSLRSAAWGGHAEAVRLLLEAGADVDGCDADGRTALRAAAWGGHEEILLNLLDHDAQVDKTDREGRTPLIAAAFMGHKEALEILLDSGAQVDLPDGDGRTALSVAALCVPGGGRGYGEVVSLLLDRGANPEHRDRDGMTPLLLSAYEGHEEVLELLLEAGADVDEAAAASSKLSSSLSAVGSSSSSSVTPLLAAASMGHAGAVSRVLFWGAAVDAIDGEGRTALCLAAARGSVEVVRALLDRGLDENHKDHLGWTPLHAAACEGHRAACAALTERGSMARVGELDVEGRTPLILAAQEGHCGTVRLLLDRHSPIDQRDYDGHSALSAATLQGHGDVAELLMRRGADTDVRDAEGRPLLYRLVLEGRLDMAALLMEKGGVPLESRDSEGRTALHVATWQGNAAALGLLLGRGADPNARDSEGRTPLHSVGWRGHVEAGRLLLEARGVMVDLACHQQGATALSIAAQEGHAEVVATLLRRGANPDHIDSYGRSPVKVAGKRGHYDIVRLLESYGAKPYPGLLPLIQSGGINNNNNPGGVSQTSTVKTQSSASSGSTGEGRGRGGGGGGTGTSYPGASSASSASASCSPASTAERFHSMQSSHASSSTCHSLATVQTVPADSLSFTQQIQQHSLPRCRSRPSTLPPPGSTAPSLHGSTKRSQSQVTKGHGCKAPPADLQQYFPSGLLLDMNQPWKGLLESLGGDFSAKPTKMESLLGEDLAKGSPQQVVGGCGGGGGGVGGGGGKWNSVMASLGVAPGGQEGGTRPVKIRDSPPLGYPPLSHHNQGDTWEAPQKVPFPQDFNFNSHNAAISPASALPADAMVAMVTNDPHLSRKQAIKLQFEGPTSALLYKRETPL